MRNDPHFTRISRTALVNWTSVSWDPVRIYGTLSTFLSMIADQLVHVSFEQFDVEDERRKCFQAKQGQSSGRGPAHHVGHYEQPGLILPSNTNSKLPFFSSVRTSLCPGCLCPGSLLLKPALAMPLSTDSFSFSSGVVLQKNVRVLKGTAFVEVHLGRYVYFKYSS